MKEYIKTYLSDLEIEKDIKILLACETGSRAWGFPSPDSDYDVRLIYVHRKEWYLSLKEEKDSIEIMLDDNEIDITGWDLRKSLRLLMNSNPALLERLQSPILYRVDENVLNELQTAAKSCYSRISTLHHYLSMAKKCYAEIEGKSSYKLKKCFYALRAATACKWILEREEMPPIEFHKMLYALDLNTDLVLDIQSLIQLKSTKSEAYLHSGEPQILQFIESCIKEASQKRQSLPSGSVNTEELNTIFRNVILT